MIPPEGGKRLEASPAEVRSGEGAELVLGFDRGRRHIEVQVASNRCLGAVLAHGSNPEDNQIEPIPHGTRCGSRTAIPRQVTPGDERMCLTLSLDREDDGRWIAEVPELPGVLVYGTTRDDAIAKAKALSLRVLADRIEHGESVPEEAQFFSVMS